MTAIIVLSKRYAVLLTNIMNGARSRTRTGTAVKPRDFLTNYYFHSRAPKTRLWSGLYLYLILLVKT